MSRTLRQALLPAVAALTVSAGSVSGQLLASSMSVQCAPGIPSCGALRFFLNAQGGDIALNNLSLIFLSSGWSFAGGPTPSVGTYNANDAFGPFGGFSSITGGTTLTIDFTDNGFPFEVWAGGTGFIDVSVTGGSTASTPYFRYSGNDVTGQAIGGTVTPEPVSLVLLGSGLAFVAGAAGRRRRRTTGTDSGA